MPYSRAHCYELASFVAASAKEAGKPYHARSYFTLPVRAEELSFVAQGNFSHGNIQFRQWDKPGTRAAVIVDVFYPQPEMLGDAMMCRMRPSKNRYGFGIFVSSL